MSRKQANCFGAEVEAKRRCCWGLKRYLGLFSTGEKGVSCIFKGSDAAKLVSGYGVVLFVIVQSVHQDISVDTKVVVQTGPSEIKINEI